MTTRLTQLREPTYIDGDTLVGDGTYNNPVRSSAGGGSSTAQRFIYTANGTETIAGFSIALPAARASVNYAAQVGCGDVAALLVFACPPSLYLVASFTCIPSANLTLGDTLIVTVEDLT